MANLFSKWILMGLTCSVLCMAQNKYIPHVTRAGGGFSTEFWLVNTQQDELLFTMTGFSQDGATTMEAHRTLAADETQRVSLAALFGEADIAWIRFADDVGVEVTAVYRAQGEDKVSAHTHQATAAAQRWRIYAGDQGLVWDGLALINPNSEASSFTYHAFDEAGNAVGTITPFAPLMPFAKDLHILSDSFPGAAYYEVSSQLPLAVTSLRGDLGTSERLWVNPALALSPAGEETTTFEITFQAAWSEETHPEAYVGISNPHFSPLGGATHQSGEVFWAPDMLASPGLVSVAETGNISTFENEVQAAINEGSADQFIAIRRNIASPGTASVTVRVHRDFPLLTLATMIAPSPDWFVGVHGFNLRPDGQWLNEASVDLKPYDAGTRENNVFQLFGPRTQPVAPISLKTDAPLGGTTMGQLILRRIP